MMVVVNMVWLRTFASTWVQKPWDCVGMDLVGVFWPRWRKGSV